MADPEDLPSPAEAPVLDVATRELGLRLHLGDLNARSRCSGYATCCACSDCQSRSERVAEEFRGWLEDPSLDAMPRLWRRAGKRVGLPWEEVSRKAA